MIMSKELKDTIEEVLTRHNPILDDIPWADGERSAGHARTSLPPASWCMLNKPSQCVRFCSWLGNVLRKLAYRIDPEG